MSTITKLNYLADTKDELKDKLNEHGANITDNDTFRSYVDKIKGIYNNWPKVTGESTEITLTPTRKGKMQLDLKGNTSQASLPTGYIALDYIESKSYWHNNNYINTGIYPNNDTKIEMDFLVRGQSGHNYDRLFGATDTLFSAQLSNYVPADYRVHNKYNNIDKDFVLNYATKYNLKREKNKIYINDELKSQFEESVFQDTNELRLFSSTTGDRDGIFVLYYCKIWDNNSLVRDFIPCKNSNNEVGLYDFVSQTFFANAGTVDFIAGNEITIPNPDYPQDIHVVTGNNTISIGGTDYPINLGSIELCKIGDYQDYLYKENGSWYKYTKINKTILDGTEAIRKSNSSVNDIFIISKNTLNNIASSQDVRNKSLSTMFTYNQGIDTINKFYFTDNSELAIVFSSYGETTLNQFID